MVTKSGTNELHGSAYEFLRNDKLDANDFFRNAANTGDTDPNLNPALKPSKLRYNQFGVTATGPVWKDHLFFTASYQGDRFITAAPPIPISSESPEWRQAVIGGLPNSAETALIYQNFPTTSPGNPNGPGAINLSDYIGGAAGFASYMCQDSYPLGFEGLATKFQSLFGVTAADQTAMAGCSVIPGLQTGSVTDRSMPFLNSTWCYLGPRPKGISLTATNGPRVLTGCAKTTASSASYQWLHSSDSYGPVNASSSIHGFANPTTNHFPNMQLSWVHTLGPNWVNEARAGYVLNRIDLSVTTPGVPAIGFDDGSAGFQVPTMAIPSTSTRTSIATGT